MSRNFFATLVCLSLHRWVCGLVLREDDLLAGGRRPGPWGGLATGAEQSQSSGSSPHDKSSAKAKAAPKASAVSAGAGGVKRDSQAAGISDPGAKRPRGRPSRPKKEVAMETVQDFVQSGSSEKYFCNQISFKRSLERHMKDPWAFHSQTGYLFFFGFIRLCLVRRQCLPPIVMIDCMCCSSDGRFPCETVTPGITHNASSASTH
jgi:hypothetical protein